MVDECPSLYSAVPNYGLTLAFLFSTGLFSGIYQFYLSEHENEVAHVVYNIALE